MSPEINNPTRTRRWMISYDITDDKNRRRIHALLKDHGQRVQYSVFECELNRRQQQALRARLGEYLNKADGDSIRWYPVCHWCLAEIQVIGSGPAPDCDGFYLL